MSHAGKYVVRCAATSGGAVTNGANTMEEMFVSSNYEKGDLICRTVISEQVCRSVGWRVKNVEAHVW